MLPKLVMLGWINVNSLLWTTVHTQICLPITVEIQRAQNYSAGDRLFKDAGGYGLIPAQNQTWQPYIERNNLQIRSEPVPCRDVALYSSKSTRRETYQCVFRGSRGP